MFLMARTLYRAIWISDIHLGSRGCQGEKLSEFLRRIDCEQLYLVGDIVDFWRLRGTTFWPDHHHDVLSRVLKLIHRGTEVILVPGNHDEVLRQYAGLELGGITIRPYAIHECLDGRRLLVTHGDQFDLIVTNSRLLSVAGSIAYEWLITINRLWNTGRRMLGRPHWSLAQYIKSRVKSACMHISRYRETLANEARLHGVDGVVCGHIHQPEIDSAADADGVTYINCGDWIEHCSAVVEHLDGRIELIWADELIRRHAAPAEDPSDRAFAPASPPPGFPMRPAARSCDVDWLIVPPGAQPSQSVPGS